MPQVAVDAAGNATAVWYRSDGTNTIVQAATRPGGGSFTAPVNLSAPGQDALAPQVAVDAAGNATAVWRRSNGTDFVVQAATRPAASGIWQTPVNLSAPGQDAFAPQVAVDPAGNATAVWQRSDGTNSIVQAATRPAAGGIWQTPVNLSAPGQNAIVPQVAVDRAGDATAVWVRYNGANTIVQAATRPAGGGFTAPVDLSATGQNASAPQVAVDPAGNATAVWQRSNGTNTIVQAATQPAGGSFSAAVDLSAPGQNANNPQVAVDPAGNAFAVWLRSNGANDIVQAAGYDFAGPRLAGLGIPASGFAGVPVAFTVAPLDVFSGPATAGWSFGDGRRANANSVSNTYTRPGRYTVTVTASDAAANTTGTNATIAIATPLRKLAITPRRFRLAGRRAGRRCVKTTAANRNRGRCRRTPKLKITYTLTAATRVQLTLTRAAPGRRAGRRCVKPTKRNRNRRRCTRQLELAGKITRNARAGTNRITFTGRLGRRRLGPGTYRLTIAPTTATPTTRTTTFKLLP